MNRYAFAAFTAIALATNMASSAMALSGNFDHARDEIINQLGDHQQEHREQILNSLGDHQEGHREQILNSLGDHQEGHREQILNSLGDRHGDAFRSNLELA